MRSEAYKESELRILKTEIDFRKSDKLKEEFSLFQNEPNPFNSVTKIEFYLPKTDEITFTVYNAAGKLLYTKEGSFGSGMQSITINREEIDGSGVLFYQLKSGDFKAIKKMIILD